MQSFTIRNTSSLEVLEWLFGKGKMMLWFLLSWFYSIPYDRFSPKVNDGNETNLVQVRFRVVTGGNLFLSDLRILLVFFVRESIMKVLTSEIFQAYVSTNYGQVNISYHCREFPFLVQSALLGWFGG